MRRVGTLKMKIIKSLSVKTVHVEVGKDGKIMTYINPNTVIRNISHHFILMQTSFCMQILFDLTDSLIPVFSYCFVSNCEKFQMTVFGYFVRNKLFSL